MVRRVLLACLLVAAAAGSVTAQDLDAQAQAIASRLRCPVCQNESVADSPSELSAQMRALIRVKLRAGERPEQIMAYFVAKYGEWILLEPPRRGLLWLVWLGPVFALGAGSLFAFRFLRAVVRPADPAGSRRYGAR